MLAVAIMLGIVVIVEAALLVVVQGQVTKVIEGARDERKHLEDRLMALTNPVALTQTAAIRDETPGEVTYVDERMEWDLENT